MINRKKNTVAHIWREEVVLNTNSPALLNKQGPFDNADVNIDFYFCVNETKLFIIKE